MDGSHGSFFPYRVFFEEVALGYPLGRLLYDRFLQQGGTGRLIPRRGRVPAEPVPSEEARYREAKRTLVFAVRRTLSFQPCKPSAHFQLPLVTSCPGLCEYCYLQTTLGPRPYIRAYVNIEEILARAARYIDDRAPETTVFEGSATSDPLPVERFTGGLAKAISFFGRQTYGRFRFVTKFTEVDSLLDLPHNGHTRFRFSVNSETVVSRYESGTPSLTARLGAAARVADAGYPLGFVIAPVIVYECWDREYRDMLYRLRGFIPENAAGDLTFEIISHRFTPRARSLILSRRPDTTVPLDEKGRRLKMGQFGYAKYVYTEEIMERMNVLFRSEIGRLFPRARIEYVI